MIFASYKFVCSDGGVVQLVRIHACHAWGRGFEPRRSRQLKQRGYLKWYPLCFNLQTEIGLKPRPSRGEEKKLFRWNNL